MNHDDAAALAGKIREAVRLSGSEGIPFRDYMAMCLYDPAGGYYMNNRPKIGREGDFYTSSSVGTAMGEMIAEYAVRCFMRAKSAGARNMRIAEWGGGTGRLALHLLDRMRDRHEELYRSLIYEMVEESPYHRSRQQELLADHADAVRFAAGDSWLEKEPDQEAFTVVLANELVDAFPVHRIRRHGGRLWEICVRLEGGAYKETLVPLHDGPVADYVSRRSIVLAEGQSAEVNLEAERWVDRVCRRIPRGALLLIDYGDVAEEIYAPHRMNGTLLCYYRHEAHERYYEHEGLQDMTTQVDFSACMASGTAAGMEDAVLLTQKQFLVEAGILEELRDVADPDPFGPQARRNRSIRQLLLSDSMSERFKVLVMARGMPSSTARQKPGFR